MAGSEKDLTPPEEELDDCSVDEERQAVTSLGNNSPSRAEYTKPALLYEGKLETMAAVCDSAFAGFGNCRTSGIPTCIRLTT